MSTSGSQNINKWGWRLLLALNFIFISCVVLWESFYLNDLKLKLAEKVDTKAVLESIGSSESVALHSSELFLDVAISEDELARRPGIDFPKKVKHLRRSVYAKNKVYIRVKKSMLRGYDQLVEEFPDDPSVYVEYSKYLEELGQSADASELLIIASTLVANMERQTNLFYISLKDRDGLVAIAEKSQKNTLRETE